MKWKANLEVFISPYAPEAIDEAKQFCDYHGFTKEDVYAHVCRKTNRVIVRTLREVTPRNDENFCFLDHLKQIGVMVH